MSVTLRLVLFVAGGAALGTFAGAGVEIITGQPGWWIVGLLGGAILGAFLGYLRFW